MSKLVYHEFQVSSVYLSRKTLLKAAIQSHSMSMKTNACSVQLLKHVGIGFSIVFPAALTQGNPYHYVVVCQGVSLQFWALQLQSGPENSKCFGKPLCLRRFLFSSIFNIPKPKSNSCSPMFCLKGPEPFRVCLWCFYLYQQSPFGSVWAWPGV